MKVTGSATLNAPRDTVWKALQDPAVLVRTIPGCQQLETTGDNAYRMTVNAGVASIKGTYYGDVRLADQDPPNAYTLVASGQGAPGTVQAEARVTLSEIDGGGTLLEYDADAVVGGMIGGVGQRVLAGVAKKTAGEFFTAVDQFLVTGSVFGAVPEGAVPEGVGGAGGAEAVPAPREPEAVGGAPSGALGAVFRAPAAAAPALSAQDFMKGAVFGAAVALLGVVVGSLIGRRR